MTKRLPREACFELGDVKVEKDIVTFNEEEDEDTLVEEGPQIERGTVFLRDTCHHVGVHQRNIFVTSGSCVECDQGDVKVEKDPSTWRKDLKLNATRCFSGTHATVRFTKETVVTGGSRVKRV